MSPVKRGLQALPLAMLFAVMAVAQANGADITKRLDGIEKATRAAQMSGDNAWMLTSSALVLMMTAPGLALFYCGLVRRKNVLATMMHGFVLMGLVTILWAVVGYSLAFSEGSPFIGGLRYLFLNGVGADPNADYAATIPAADVHGLPVHVRDHYARSDLRRVRRAHAILGHAAVHDAVDVRSVFSDGAHGLG